VGGEREKGAHRKKSLPSGTTGLTVNSQWAAEGPQSTNTWYQQKFTTGWC